MKTWKWLIAGVVAACLLALVVVPMFSNDPAPDDRRAPTPVRIVAVLERTVFQADPPTEIGQKDALTERLRQCTNTEWTCEVTVLLGEGDANAARVLADTRRLTVERESGIRSAKIWALQAEDIAEERQQVVDDFVEEVIADLVQSPVSKGCTNLFGSVRTALSELGESGTETRKELVLMASGNSNCPPVVLADSNGTILTQDQAIQAAAEFASPDAAQGIRLGFHGFGRTFLSEGRLMAFDEREDLNDVWIALAEFWGFTLERSPLDGGTR